MKTSIFTASLLAAFAATAGCASTQASLPVEVKYTVLREDVSIPFTNSVRNFRVGLDHSLLLESQHNRWYRATLPEPCKSDLRWEQAVGLADRVQSSVSKFTDVVVDGRRCRILTLDEIDNPKAAEAAARAAAAESAPT